MNRSNLGMNETEESVQISEVSLFCGTQELLFGERKGVRISEVSSFQGLNCMQELFLEKEKVSLLERCPHFRSVFRERFHCT